MRVSCEITEDLFSRLAPLRPEIVRSVEHADVIKVDASSLFQGLHKHFLMVVVDWQYVEEALNQRKSWLTTLIYECLLEPSPVVPIVLNSKKGNPNHVESIRRNGSEGVKGQPIIEYKSLEGTKLTPKEILRQAIVDSEARFKVIPYNVHSTAVSGMFFGRKDELQDIYGGQGHVFIIGARRIGKTSLVTKLVETINNEPKYARIEMGGIVIDKKAAQLDVSQQGANISTTLWKEILKQFGLTDEKLTLYSRKVSGRKNKPIEDAAFALQKLIDNANGKLTIVLDEMDGWIKKEAGSGWQTIERLRALTDGGRARLILVGYEMFRKALQNDRFPLYGRGTLVSLGPIDRPTLSELVTKPLLEFGISIEREEIITKIWKKSGGMPHVVQDVCKILLNDCLGERSKMITLRHVSTAFRKSGKFEEFLRGVINCTFPLAEAIAGIIALSDREGAVETKNIVGELERFKYEYDGDEFELALDYLIMRCAIEVAGDYRGSWRMQNEGQREYMFHHIANKGVDNWLSALVKKHKLGKWKDYYENLL